MMGKSQIITAALIAVVTIASVHSTPLSAASRQGAIDSAYVEPTSPTTAEPVVLHVSVQDHLQLDRVDTRRIGNTFVVRVYWQEPPADSTGSGPTDCQESLGTLPKGKYNVLIHSSCERLLAGTARVSFEVTEAPAPGSGDSIEDVWVTPDAPTTGGAATVHVSGHWPTSGYSMPVAMTQSSGHTSTVDLYWSSPRGPVAYVVTPYHYEAALRLYTSGTHTVRARVYLDGRLADTAEMSFEVTPGSDDDDGWPWNF